MKKRKRVLKKFGNIDEHVPVDTKSMLVDAAYLDGKRDTFEEVRKNILGWVEYFDEPMPKNLNDKIKWIVNQEIRKFLMELFEINEKELLKHQNIFKPNLTEIKIKKIPLRFSNFKNQRWQRKNQISTWYL